MAPSCFSAALADSNQLTKRKKTSRKTQKNPKSSFVFHLQPKQDRLRTEKTQARLQQMDAWEETHHPDVPIPEHLSGAKQTWEAQGSQQCCP